MKIIEGLESDGSIQLETYEDGSTSYVISDVNSVFSNQICPQPGSFFKEENAQLSPTAAGSPQSRSHIYEDILDFKKYVQRELFELKAFVLNRLLPETKSPDYERLFTRSLEYRKVSFERQLAYKHNMIEQLVESQGQENKDLLNNKNCQVLQDLQFKKEVKCTQQSTRIKDQHEHQW